MEAIDVDQLFYGVAQNLNRDLSTELKGDCVFVSSAMVPPLDDVFRVSIESIQDPNNPQDHLVVMLETNGGYIETVERIVSVIRKHYKEVSFIVPSHAFSAGTVLVLSGDHIFMDYYSVLGPIDPQFADEEGRSLLPGAGYLAKFEELTKIINADAKNEKKAELAYLVRKFDPAKLFHIEQAIEHGQSLIETWLPKYKFKNWKKTKTNGKKVTSAMRTNRAKKIAEILGNAEKWHSHGRGITMKELSEDEINLLIEDFGSKAKLTNVIRNYHGLCIDYAAKNGIRNFIHTSQRLRRV